MRPLHRSLVAAGLLALCACDSGAPPVRGIAGGNAQDGQLAIEALGCAICHIIPGVAWPRGNVGPSLAGFAERNLIAGVVVNRPDTVAAFVRNATAVLPRGAMPPIAMTDQQARDIAAYLGTLRSEDAS